VAAGNGQDAPHIVDDLIANIPEYDFFQAVYLAEILTRGEHAGRKDFGFDQKGLKFRPSEKYSFPATDIRSCVRKDDALEMVLNFMGLYGVNSPLPRCYHEHIVLHQYAHGRGNVPLQNFLDIFDNRFYWLYFLAWKKYRSYLALSEDRLNDETGRVMSFLGSGVGQWAPEDGIDPVSMLQFSGMFSNRVRNRSGLKILLRECFEGMPVAIQEFVPHTVTFSLLPVLGRKRGDGACRLGVNTVVGRSTTDTAGRICVKMGPMPFGKYVEFLPAGVRAAQLRKLLGWYLHDNLFSDVELSVRCSAIPRMTLGDHDRQLGLTTWIGQPRQEVVTSYFPFERYGMGAG
jgi:type VI secretion system protein ImpH